MADIDSFKAFNDTYGHLEGDECLKKIAAALNHQLMRPSDLAARFGGEEFIILLPGTDLEGAGHLAEAIRRDVENLAITHAGAGASGRVTMSFGISALIPRSELTEIDLINTADRAMYLAKEGGRNRCVVLNMD